VTAQERQTLRPRVCKRGHTITGRQCSKCDKARKKLYAQGKSLNVDTHGVIPADRLAAALNRYIQEDGIQNVASRAGVPVRRLQDIISGRSSHASLTTTDRLLTLVGLGHLWHLAPEDGGFADIYHDGVAA
jgi:hypothetical protein